MTITIIVIRFCLATFLLYGIGYAVPHLRADLQLTDSIAGLHGSAAAAGLIASGVIGDRIARRLGVVTAARLAVGLLAVSATMIAFGGTAWLTLAGSLALGFSSGGLTLATNERLTAPGGRTTVILLARANVAALAAAACAPLAIAAAEESGLGGRIGLLAPVPVLVVVEALNRRRENSGTRVPQPTAARDLAVRLPRAYWRAWLVLALAIGIEFSVVFWSASLIVLRTGATTSEATTAAAAFLVGMMIVRIGISAGFGAQARQTTLMAVAFVGVIVGVAGVWQSETLAGSAIALFIAGVGVGPLYPIGIAKALGAAPGAALAAAARVTFAAGLAILVAPFGLSLLAEQVGLVNAWPAVAALATAAIVLLVTGRFAVGPTSVPERAQRRAD